MRLTRPLLLAAGVVVVIAAWPQDLRLPAVDHSQHPLVEVREDLPVPSLVIRLIPDRMDGFNVFLDTRNFVFTPENVGQTAISSEGHAHLYVNGEKVARLYSPWHHLSGKLLREGINRIEVEFSTNDHSVWGVAGAPIGADVLIDTLDDDGDPIVREDVRYTLDWQWGKAKRNPAGGWQVSTDLGYNVHVTGGRLVTRNLELVPCHDVPQPSPQARLIRRLQPIPVFAGHSSLIPNESKISRSFEEDLSSPARVFLEGRTVTDPEYCRAHYLIARPTGSGPGAYALEVEGTWSRGADGLSQPFSIRSPVAYGQFLDLLSSEGDDLARRMIVGGIDLTVRRSLETMFDGVDFADGNLETAGMRIMRTVVARTEIVVAGT